MEPEYKVPVCVGVIVDGNRRWAKERGLPTMAGHEAGRQQFKEFVRWAAAAGVGHVVAYAFSTENWNRSEAEVSFLVTLLGKVLITDIDELHAENMRFRAIGVLSRFPVSVQNDIRAAEEKTKNNTGLCVTLALSYGGRDEIAAAAQAACADAARAGRAITVDDISARVWTTGIPDPDMIIRTSGEMRLSNFLPWQSVYSELFFTKTLWPDFAEAEFKEMLAEYADRERRFGA